MKNLKLIIKNFGKIPKEMRASLIWMLVSGAALIIITAHGIIKYPESILPILISTASCIFGLWLLSKAIEMLGRRVDCWLENNPNKNVKEGAPHPRKETP